MRWLVALARNVQVGSITFVFPDGTSERMSGPEPGPDAGFWFLVRVNPGDVGTYDSGSFRQSGLRDGEIVGPWDHGAGHGATHPRVNRRFVLRPTLGEYGLFSNAKS